MIRTSKLDMDVSVNTESVSGFIDNAGWAIFTTYHTVLESSPGVEIFGREMLFDIPYISDWKKIRKTRQAQTNRQTLHENASRVDFDYTVGVHVLVREDGILRKAAAKYTGPFHITTLHTNGKIRIQKEAFSNHLDIRRVKLFFQPDTETYVEDDLVE